MFSGVGSDVYSTLLFAVGNQILDFSFPHHPPSIPLQSLCTAANTTLITPLSIGPFCTLKGKEVLSLLSVFCHPFPPLLPFHNLPSFPCAVSSPCRYFLPGNYVYVQIDGKLEWGHFQHERYFLFAPFFSLCHRCLELRADLRRLLKYWLYAWSLHPFSFAVWTPLLQPSPWLHASYSNFFLYLARDFVSCKITPNLLQGSL